MARRVKRKRKLNFAGIAVITGLFILLGIIFIAKWYSNLDKPITLNGITEVNIAQGSNTKAISEKLYGAGLTRHEISFSLYAKKQGIENKLKPGLYSFEGLVTLEDIAEKLVAGKLAEEIRITIPEGLTVKQTGEIFASQGLIDLETFLELANNGDFPYAYLPPKGAENRLEGFLFPDTYMISYKWDEADILNLLLGQFDKIWKDQWRDRAKELNMDTLEIITLASIIEKEAKVAQDRPIISGVFHNRLKIKMALQSCATVQFILGEPKNPLLYADLEIESPYNTYKNQDLPPGPIAAPGKAAIEAALYPEDNEYLYFVAKSDGSHYFSKTLAEHNAAKRKYLNQ